jgi:hypothetical protein
MDKNWGNVTADRVGLLYSPTVIAAIRESMELSLQESHVGDHASHINALRWTARMPRGPPKRTQATADYLLKQRRPGAGVEADRV